MSEKRFENHLFYIDEERADVVFPRLIDAYVNKQEIYKDPNLSPVHLLPLNLEGSVDQAKFHFYSIMGDCRVKSEVNYRKFKDLHQKDKKYFDPKFLASQPIPQDDFGKPEKGTLGDIIRGSIGSDSPVRLSRYIIQSSKTLVDNYDSNPLNIFKDIKDVREARKKIIREFDGYGPQLSSLLLIYYIMNNLIHFDNDNELLPKVDFHDITITFALGVLKPKFTDPGKGMGRERVADKLQEFLSYYVQKYNKSIFELDEALWILGSSVCSRVDWLECYDKCAVKEYCYIKPGSDYKKDKKHNGEILEKYYKIYPLIESRRINIGDLADLFIPSFDQRILK